MGYTTRTGQYGGHITDFWPDDGSNHFWLASSYNASLDGIIAMCRNRWGKNVDLENILIESEKIRTKCINYDVHDPSDWTDFLKIRLTQSKKT